jgi:outer membrane immunogenic protein
MRNSKLIVSAIVAISTVVGIGASSAADLAARPYTKAPPMIAMYDWSGFYVGINGGGGWSHKCWDRSQNAGTAAIVTLSPAIAEGCHDASGATAGGQVGYRWQAASWVFGLEAQGNWTDFRGSTVVNPLLFANTTNRTKIDSLGLFTGQVGYAWNNVLAYVKGGAAVAGDKYEGLATNTGIVFDRATETRVGGVIGVGLEFGFTRNWSFAVEYDHAFMGDRDITFNAITNTAFSRVDRISQDVDMVTARVNYHFGGPVVAKY